jgi:hypothetical protein
LKWLLAWLRAAIVFGLEGAGKMRNELPLTLYP